MRTQKLCMVGFVSTATYVVVDVTSWARPRGVSSAVQIRDSINPPRSA
jgi:hypothetical protein